jgi:hypothetical protein
LASFCNSTGRRAASAVLVTLHLLASPCAAQGTQQQPGVLNGRVVDARTGSDLPYAVVSIPTASLTTRADSWGRFGFAGLAPGELMVVATAVGYRPARASLVIVGGQTVELDVELEPIPPLLRGVVTTAFADAPRNLAMSEFEARRAMRLGRFLTRQELLVDRGRSLDAVLLTRFAGVRIVTEGHRKVAVSGRAGGRIRSAEPCRVNVIVDLALRYQNVPGAEVFDLRTLEASMIAAVEFYTTATLPAEFNMGSNSPCGALVIWLQH